MAELLLLAVLVAEWNEFDEEVVLCDDEAGVTVAVLVVEDEEEQVEVTRDFEWFCLFWAEPLMLPVDCFWLLLLL